MDTVFSHVMDATLDRSGQDNLKDFLVRNEKIINRNLEGINTALASLSPTKHGMALLFILGVQSEASGQPLKPEIVPTVFAGLARRAILEAPKLHITLAGQKAVEGCRRLSLLAREQKIILRGLPGLFAHVLGCVTPSAHTLTSLHPIFLQAALLGKQYALCAPVLDTPMLDVRPREAPITAEDILLYFYYGGMAAVGLKRFPLAQEFFRQCLCVPATLASAISVEAYKKLILVSLIVDGEVRSLPKSAPAVVIRPVKKLVAAYDTIVTSYSTLDPAAVQASITAATDVLLQDRNLGLAKQVLSSVYHARVLRLTHVYLTIPLSTLAMEAGLPSPESAEKLLLDMVESGSLVATIDQSTGMVSFQEVPVLFDDDASAAKLHRAIQGVLSLAEHIKGVDKELSVNPQYLKKLDLLSGSQVAAAGGGGGGAGTLGMSEMSTLLAMGVEVDGDD